MVDHPPSRGCAGQRVRLVRIGLSGCEASLDVKDLAVSQHVEDGTRYLGRERPDGLDAQAAGASQQSLKFRPDFGVESHHERCQLRHGPAQVGAPIFGVTQALALPVGELGGWGQTAVRLKILGRSEAPNVADFGGDDRAEHGAAALDRLERLGGGAVRHFSNSISPSFSTSSVSRTIRRSWLQSM